MVKQFTSQNRRQNRSLGAATLAHQNFLAPQHTRRLLYLYLTYGSIGAYLIWPLSGSRLLSAQSLVTTVYCTRQSTGLSCKSSKIGLPASYTRQINRSVHSTCSRSRKAPTSGTAVVRSTTVPVVESTSSTTRTIRILESNSRCSTYICSGTSMILSLIHI